MNENAEILTDQRYPPATLDSATNSDESMAISWTIHPMIERKAAALLAILVVNAVGVIIFRSTGELIWALLAVGFLLFSLNRFFLSSTFELTQTGIVARYPLKKISCAWMEVDHWIADRQVVWVARKGGRDRGDIQLFLKSGHDDVLKFLARHATGRMK